MRNGGLTPWLTPWLTLAVGVTVVSGLVLVLARVSTVPAARGAERLGDGGAARVVSGADARGRLVALAQGSRGWMPAGFETVSIGMTVERLRAARPAVVLGQGSRDGRNQVWEERSADGNRVAYLVASGIGVVTQVQFMARLPGPDGLLEDFRSMRQRHGDPTGFWDCPETETASAIRRITWWGPDASLMEAVLVYPGGVSVTRIVGATGDVAAALQRSRCQPVTEASLTAWPIATELRGERVPFTNPR